jgi:hypothetical protein
MEGETMSVIYTFALGAVFAFLVSLVTVGVLRPHLARLLEELCGSRARASFWMVVSTLCIFLFGLLAGTVSYGYGAKAALSAQELFFGLITQMRVCLIGLLVSLLTVAWVLLRFTQRFEQGVCPAPSRDGDARATEPTPA